MFKTICFYLEVGSEIERLLDENNRLLNQIEGNIMTFQAQNNIDLFHRARRNINELVHATTQLPGMSTKMPPLRISVNESLASFVLPGIAMDQVIGSSHLEEPRGW
ncbi:unnamed protein product [Urochloa humidicola]